MVQFYGEDRELAASVSNYLGEGLVAADRALVLATLPHRLAFEAELAATGIDVGTAKATGRLLVLDAAETLQGFWSGDHLDHNRFDAIVSGLIGPAAGAGQPVRIYAEMVTLLWEAGQVAAAIELELLWNDLGSRLPFSLLCAYPTRPVTAEADVADLTEVGELHNGVIGDFPSRPVHATAPYQQARAVRTFPQSPESARAARHFVFDTLSQREDHTLAVDAAIVTAELAANAVLHARSAFTVTVSQSAAGARISVRDAAPLQAPNGHAPLDVSHGHGLWVVDQVADNWAVEPLPDGKVVWAELPGGVALAVDPRCRSQLQTDLTVDFKRQAALETPPEWIEPRPRGSSPWGYGSAGGQPVNPGPRHCGFSSAPATAESASRGGGDVC